MQFRIKSLLVAALVAVPALVAVTFAPAAQAATAVPRTPAFAKAIEPMAAYVGQTSCEPGYRARNVKQHLEANAFIQYLLATDKYGNRFANARRMGVMYIIFNNRMWGSWDGKWESYNNCAATPAVGLDSACHRNHVHISLSWSGALARTSYWSASHQAYPVQDYGVCPAADMNWAADYKVIRQTPCPRHPTLVAKPGSSMAKTWVVRYSGAVLFPGMTGQPVRAVQMAFNIPQTGRYDATTITKVNHLRAAYHLTVNSIVDIAIWRLLIARTP